MLRAIASISLLRLTPSLVGLTLQSIKKASTVTPYRKVMTREKTGKALLHNVVSSPPKAPTDVAPTLFMKRAPRASRTAFTTISNLSMGAGTKRLVTNTIEPNNAAVNNRLVFCTVPPFFLNGAIELKNFDVTQQKSEWGPQSSYMIVRRQTLIFSLVFSFLNAESSDQIRLLATKFSNTRLHDKLDGRIGVKLMGRPKIGLSMLFCLGEPFDMMVKRLATVKTRYVEIVDDGFHTLNRGRVSKLAEAAKSYGLEYTLHSPFADINIASPSKPLLNAILKRLRQSIGWAGDLNANLWVLHPGLITGISMFYPGREWKQNIQSIQDLLKFAGDQGVNVGLETMPGKYGFIMKNTEDFARFYRESGLEMGIVLDTGHANLEGQLESYLKVFPGKIVHIHASDNFGETDQHLGIGYGRIDWKRFAETLKEIAYSKTLITESTEHVDESMQKLKQLFT